jgi:hypothetical protein
VRDLERGGQARKSRAEDSARNTLGSHQEDLEREKPGEARERMGNWEGPRQIVGKPLRRKKARRRSRTLSEM